MSLGGGAGFIPARQVPMGGDPADSPERERWRARKPLPYDVGYCAEYGLDVIYSMGSNYGSRVKYMGP